MYANIMLGRPVVLFSRVARHLACLAFCKLQEGIFQRSVLFID